MYVYNDHKELKKLWESKKDVWTISFTRYRATDTSDMAFPIEYVFVPISEARRRICGILVHLVRFLDGDFKAEDINYCLSRIRLINK